MKKLTCNAIFATLMTVFAAGAAQATVLTENFNQPFPAWETNWFGVNSDARNIYCGTVSGCATRGNNPDGLWLNGSSDISVTFGTAFGASLTSLTLGVAGYDSTILSAYDSLGNQIFSENVTLTSGAFGATGIYSYYTIASSTGISRFAFSGWSAGNTSIDNLTATTRDVPEPASIALIGLGLLGAAAARRRTAKK